MNSEVTSAATWIAEVERERRSIERADPEDKRTVYDELGVDLTYHQEGRVHVAARARVLRDRVGGAIHTASTRDPWEAWLVAA